MRKLPRLSSLRPFEAAARLESFSLAADELGMTQTAVSKQIAQLEEDLGAPLFVRRNRAVFVTEAGRRFGRTIGTSLSDIGEEWAALRGVRRTNELVLRCQLCEAFYWLMPRLSGFHARHPEIEIRVASSVEPLANSTEQFDVAMQSSGRPSGSARLAFTAADDIFPVCAPSVVSELTCPLKPHDLLAFPLLSHRVVPQDWMEWSQWFEAVGPPASRRPQMVHFDSYPLALQAAATGQGIALGWQRTTEALIAEGKLIKPCIEYVGRPAELSVFRGSQGSIHPDADKLVSWLADELST